VRTCTRLRKSSRKIDPDPPTHDFHSQPPVYGRAFCHGRFDVPVRASGLQVCLVSLYPLSIPASRSRRPMNVFWLNLTPLGADDPTSRPVRVFFIDARSAHHHLVWL